MLRGLIPWCALLALGMALADGLAPTPMTFSYRLKTAAAWTSAGVYDAAGRLVRQLWTMEPRTAGTLTGRWDGLDEFGQPAPAGAYTFRVVANRGRYRNVGILGNTGTDELQHIQHGMLAVTVDAKGNIYTANGWEEGGQDFKVQDPTGKTLFHARYQMRNGDPNGAPYSIAVDDGFIYCGMSGWSSEQWKSRTQIQRFRIADGTLTPFTGITENRGHIQLYEWPEKLVPKDTPEADAQYMRSPLRALAINGDTIYATDALAGKIVKYHKVTGIKQGEFAAPLPMALAFDKDGRLWVGHEHRQVSIFTTDGTKVATPLTDLGEVNSLAFGPDGMLYIADGKANVIKRYTVDGITVKPAGAFGQPALPGDAAPDHFYQLTGATVDAQGNLVTIQHLPTGGARMARFAPDGKCLWEQMALVFCDLGKYDPAHPTEFITHRLHRLELIDKDKGTWAYRGTLIKSDPRYIDWQHGVLTPLTLGGKSFLFQCYGDGLQVYRREGDTLTLAAMVGGHNPGSDGVYDDKQPAEQRRPLGQWTWTDVNNDGIAQDSEVVWFAPPGKGQYATFGINIDAHGNLLYCDHYTRAIWELPLSGLSANGNPVYDWRLVRQIVAPDTSPVKFFPLMAVRAEDGTLYSFGRSDGWKQPKNQGAWMGGWALLRYDAQGKTLWAARLPQVCVGMDAVPGGGVMLGWYEKAIIYHYTADGLLIGSLQPGPAAGNTTGWMDNTSAVAVARDPRDHQLDVFGEDSWLNRLLWYRVDDRDIETITGKLVLAK